MNGGYTELGQGEAVGASMLVLEPGRSGCVSKQEYGPEEGTATSKWTYRVVLVCLLLLFLPHGYNQGQVLVIHLCVLHIIERLHEDLAHAGIARTLQKLASGIDELLVEVSRKGCARVVGQYAQEHDGVVLP